MTPHQAARGSAVKDRLTTRPRRVVETSEYAAFGRRMLSAWSRRVADGDPDDLTEMLTMSRALDALLREAVRGQRSRHGTSWASIGQAAGTTRQAAQQRWG